MKRDYPEMEEEKVTLLIPELPKKTRHFMGEEVEILSEVPEEVQGIALYAYADALSKYEPLVVVFAAKSAGSVARLYKVGASKSILDKLPRPFYADALLGTYVILASVNDPAFISRPHVPIPGNDWMAISNDFDVMGALFYLGVVSSISSVQFENTEVYFKRFFDEYQIPPPITTALSRIFRFMILAFEFFGYLIPSTVNERLMLQNCVNGLESDEFYFADVSWAIRKYTGQPCLTSQDFFRLVSDYEKVRRFLTPRPGGSLLDKLHKFQKENHIQSDFCDQFTFRRILYFAGKGKLPITTFSRFAGINLDTGALPLYQAKIRPISTFSDDQTVLKVEEAMNGMLMSIYTHEENTQWAFSEGEKVIGNCEGQVRSIDETLRVIESSTNDLERRFNKVLEANRTASQSIEETSVAMKSILDSYLAMSRSLENIKPRFNNEKEGKEMLFALIFALVAVHFVLWFKQ